MKKPQQKPETYNTLDGDDSINPIYTDKNPVNKTNELNKAKNNKKNRLI